MILRRELRPDARPPSIRFRAPNLHLPLRLLVAGWLAVLAVRAAWWLLQHPRTTVLAGLVVWAWWTSTLYVVAVVLVVGVTVTLGWWVTDEASARRLLVEPAGRWWRRWTVYARHWQPAMLTAGLTLRESWGGDLPVLRGVRGSDGRDVLRVRVLPGQTLERWKDAGPQLASTWNVQQVRVRRVTDRPQELDLLIIRSGTGRNRHVTEPAADLEPVPDAAPRGAFPRAPRGAA
jgi:S-DNA-T family DNA segregation ATPase FtsK/SpoIIIE